MSGSRAFKVAATGARLATGVAVIAALRRRIVAAVHAPWPVIRHDAARVDVTPLPGDSVLVLQRRPARARTGRHGSAGAELCGVADPHGRRNVGRSVLGGSDGAGSSRRGRGARSHGRCRRTLGTVDRRRGVDHSRHGRPLRIRGRRLWSPPTEFWLVGGSTATGTEDIVTLTNAAEVPSTVTLSVYGETRSARTVIVPARTQTALPLTSIAAGDTAPVVRVDATGASGPCGAAVVAHPGARHPPAWTCRTRCPARSRSWCSPEWRCSPLTGTTTRWRFCACSRPGADARVQVRVVAEGAGSAADEFTVPLEPDLPAQVSLSGLEPGRYTVEVDSEEPVVAALRQQDGFGRDADFAWSPRHRRSMARWCSRCRRVRRDDSSWRTRRMRTPRWRSSRSTAEHPRKS